MYILLFPSLPHAHLELLECCALSQSIFPPGWSGWSVSWRTWGSWPWGNEDMRNGVETESCWWRLTSNDAADSTIRTWGLEMKQEFDSWGNEDVCWCRSLHHGDIRTRDEGGVFITTRAETAPAMTIQAVMIIMSIMSIMTNVHIVHNVHNVSNVHNFHNVHNV